MTVLRTLAGVLTVGLLLILSASWHAAGAETSTDLQHISQLGPGDSVSVQVFGQTDVMNAYVGDDGMISLPLAGNIQVAGSSPVEAASRVAKALKDGGYFVDPHVTVTVTQARSQLVSVVGEVQTAGRFPINPRTTIVDLLAQAGGAKATASDVGIVLRSDADGHTNRYPVKLNGLTDLKDVLPTATLLGGDSLIVPRAESYYIAGAVTMPGTYSIEPDMTVIRALARAGGVTERGSERRIQLKRKGKDGTYRMLHPKLNDPVQADDMIRVKESIF
jgi:polysaccharide biosynthesis/export protein